jgi:hypothetical protein
VAIRVDRGALPRADPARDGAGRGTAPATGAASARPRVLSRAPPRPPARRSARCFAAKHRPGRRAARVLARPRCCKGVSPRNTEPNTRPVMYPCVADAGGVSPRNTGQKNNAIALPIVAGTRGSVSPRNTRHNILRSRDPPAWVPPGCFAAKHPRGHTIAPDEGAGYARERRVRAVSSPGTSRFRGMVGDREVRSGHRDDARDALAVRRPTCSPGHGRYPPGRATGRRRVHGRSDCPPPTDTLVPLSGVFRRETPGVGRPVHPGRAAVIDQVFRYSRGRAGAVPRRPGPWPTRTARGRGPRRSRLPHDDSGHGGPSRGATPHRRWAGCFAAKHPGSRGDARCRRVARAAHAGRDGCRWARPGPCPRVRMVECSPGGVSPRNTPRWGAMAIVPPAKQRVGRGDAPPRAEGAIRGRAPATRAPGGHQRPASGRGCPRRQSPGPRHPTPPCAAPGARVGRPRADRRRGATTARDTPRPAARHAAPRTTARHRRSAHPEDIAGDREGGTRRPGTPPPVGAATVAGGCVDGDGMHQGTIGRGGHLRRDAGGAGPRTVAGIDRVAHGRAARRRCAEVRGRVAGEGPATARGRPRTRHAGAGERRCVA